MSEADVDGTMMDKLGLLDISPKMVSELAMGMEQPSAVFARYGITVQGAERLMNNDFFRSMLQKARHDWNSIGQADKRVRMKALVAVEEMMPHMYAMGVDPDMPGPVRNETFKTFAGLSGVRDREQAGTGSQFSITINVPSDKGTENPLVIEAPALQDAETQ